jgi:hypothetical protein
VAGDFNGDGRLDLAVANNFSNSVAVLLGNGDGTFAPPVDYGVPNGPTSVAIGDFNGDGRPDLTVTAGDAVSILLGNGDGTFSVAATSFVVGDIGSIPAWVAVGDFNGDGRPDLAVANMLSSNVSILTNTSR